MKEMIDFLDNKKFQPLTFRKPFSYEYKYFKFICVCPVSLARLFLLSNKKHEICRMFNPILFYCYDAYCGWCYGFSKIIAQIDASYNKYVQIEVLSGGMILPEKPVAIAATAAYIEKAYPTVEELTGVKFGEDYLWHIKNPAESDWYPNSEKPSIALSIFKEYYPDKQVEFSSNLQYALHFEGRDLTDNESYKHLLEKFSINEEAFYTKLESDEYKEKAHYEFQLCKQL